MHRDEQSVWQAGSYSFLTPASADWYKQNSRPPPSPPPPPPCFPHSQVYFLCPSLSLAAFFLHTHPVHYTPPPPSLSVYSYSPSLFLPISPPFFFPEARVSLLALHTITSIHQLSARVLFSFLTSLFSTPWQQPPPSLHTHVSPRHPPLTSHPSGQLNVPPRTLGLLFPSTPFVCLQSSPLLQPPSYQMSPQFGWVCMCGAMAGTKRPAGGSGGGG